jgi:hypothetical protein
VNQIEGGSKSLGCPERCRAPKIEPFTRVWKTCFFLGPPRGRKGNFRAAQRENPDSSKGGGPRGGVRGSPRVRRIVHSEGTGEESRGEALPVARPNSTRAERSWEKRLLAGGGSSASGSGRFL